ncbi:MAG: hypothetical protein HZT40_22500 [Candidatus Thiothrix singaporensis]|uniref:Uncharacterized protein n=1 Tax=Candidatus Thiothrix singaporensis TaxID=2799669 RepID=A0A7L6AY29_9GAMM|nr:MAG: hypothetical protein HZT40_22500 [Candidatus Thiothrix singaporensis]
MSKSLIPETDGNNQLNPGIPLADLCPIVGLSYRVMVRKIHKGELPIKYYTLTPSRKAPKYVTRAEIEKLIRKASR